MKPSSRDRFAWHPTALLAVLALWLATAGNLPLWRAIWNLSEGPGARPLGVIGLLVLVVAGLILAMLCLLVWPRWRRGAGLLLLALAAFSSHFMLAYGIVIDPSMMSNVLHTDAREVRDLLGGAMVWTLLLGVVLPGLWWWRQPLRATTGRRLGLQQGGVAVFSLLLALVLVWVAFQDLASLMRNHKSLRYMVNPFNTVYALGRAAAGERSAIGAPLQVVGEDAHLVVPVERPEASPLIVLVVGETARAANFGLGGYARDTTPELRRLRDQGDLVYFTRVSSCGTNTQTSVPCMFSHLGRDGYTGSTQRHENLLDVLQRAGLAVLWLDNQSGCKGVCDRVEHADTRGLALPGLCEGGECLDEVLLRELPAALQRLDPQRRAQGTVVVLHQMGSHGPAYHKRSPAAFKVFGPECTSASLQDCAPEQLVNTYDNSLRYTDHFLAETVRWLQAQPRPTGLVYLSDHGESLGEKGLYLHGMPYRIAPQEQTHVPQLVWLSGALQRELGVDMGCVREGAGRELSHDHLFHTLLGLARVATRVADPRLDALAPCTRRADTRT